MSPSKIQCIQASITLRASVLTQIYDQVIWQAHLVWQYSWQRLTALIKFCLQTATLLSVLAIGLKNIWRLTGTSTSCSWLSMPVILCVVGYDCRSKSIMAMAIQSTSDECVHECVHECMNTCVCIWRRIFCKWTMPINFYLYEQFYLFFHHI